MEKPNIREQLSKRILILDGATGTALQEMNLTAADFGGEALNGCNEHLVLTKPDAISNVHKSYLEAGADIIETNTFGATHLVLGEYELQSKVAEINTKAVELAIEMAKIYSTPEKPRYVSGAIGPTTKSLSVTGGITFDELAKEFEVQCEHLIKAGVDYLLFETALDTLNLKAAYIGALKAFKTCQKEIPIAISCTIETMGTMLAGQGVEAMYASVEHMNPLYIGLNCATGPEFMRDHIRTLSEISKFPISVVPNAGIPNAEGQYPESPAHLAKILGDFMDQGWINVVGGCCGTTAAHITEIAKIASTKKPRKLTPKSLSRLSGIEPLILEDDSRPYIIGERTNVIGSRMFKQLITEQKLDESTEIARKQVKAGAHIIDICLSNTDRDEIQDTHDFYQKVTKMIKIPIMVDSQVPEVVETAFKYTQGKCILNSVNLEEGEKYFKDLLPLVKQYGAGVVVGCIRGEMAVTAKEKLEVAIESYELLTKKYEIPEEDIYWDPLVFPCGTGDENYFGSGAETIEGVRLIKQKYPKTRSTLGISNVSFGLPPAGREVLNSLFLHHCVKAGLDTAIVNSEKLVRYNQITEEEKKLCNDLLWNKTENGDPIANFAAYFRDKSVIEKPKADRSKLTVDQKLEINIVEGTKEFLIENLDEALKKYQTPLKVINQPLMAAMSIVGRMFNQNELIVAEVLQSAEAMKAAVAYLEQFMEANEVTTRGTMLLATVKGDVHDIGKNLVQIILENNGFNVIDLGIKCPPETLIAAIKEHNPDFVGLSGLLVKSAQQMVSTAADFKAAGINIPILVGGAALTQSFSDLKISATYDGLVIYCKDAMSGLAVANDLTSETAQEWIKEQKKVQQNRVHEKDDIPKKAPLPLKEKIIFDHSNLQSKIPHYKPVIIEESFDNIWPYINPQMVYGNHLGLKGNVETMLKNKEEKAVKLHTLIESLKEKIIKENLIKAKGMYQFFNVKPTKETIIVLNENRTKELTRFTFPRQSSGHQLSLADFLNPEGDTLCFFVVTCGDGVAEKAKTLLEEGHYFESHGLSAIALEAAEGFAECIHKRIRHEWKIPDDPGLTRHDIFKQKYIGKRYSFGYPACPLLEDQAVLWNLLNPDKKIGITLSEDFMMHPEASVSAMVFHHPQSRYFKVAM